LASKNKILSICLNMLKETILIHSYMLPSIWQHIKVFTLHKITFIARPWCSLGGPTQKGHAFAHPE